MYTAKDPEDNHPMTWAKWARSMAYFHPYLSDRYVEYETKYLLENLAKEENQDIRAECERRLKELGLRSRTERKKRWRDYYHSKTQKKIAALFKAGKKEEAQKLIEKLKSQK